VGVEVFIEANLVLFLPAVNEPKAVVIVANTVGLGSKCVESTSHYLRRIFLLNMRDRRGSILRAPSPNPDRVIVIWDLRDSRMTRIPFLRLDSRNLADLTGVWPWKKLRWVQRMKSVGTAKRHAQSGIPSCFGNVFVLSKLSMRRFYSRFLLVVFFAISVCVFAQEPHDATQESSGGDAMAHTDHKPKHGGTFFMSLDNMHHLEGVLLPPGTFRVYLYDDHTKPLKADQVKLVSGTIQTGDAEDAPKIALGPGKKKETIEALLAPEVKFPMAVTLLLHLPGMAPDAQPELFNFTFSKFTDENGPGTCAPMAKMPNMRC